MTRAQKQHAREQRAVRALRRAAVRYTLASDGNIGAPADLLPLAFAELTAACDKYTTVIGLRSAIKLAKPSK